VQGGLHVLRLHEQHACVLLLLIAERFRSLSPSR
jgi:hypothetical protein